MFCNSHSGKKDGLLMHLKRKKKKCHGCIELQGVKVELMVELCTVDDVIHMKLDVKAKNLRKIR